MAQGQDLEDTAKQMKQKAQSQRTASAVWNGGLMDGSGQVTADSSGAFKNLDVTWASRTAGPEGKTSPEELIAAAHAVCYSMALSAELTGAGHKPDQLAVNATVGLDPSIDGGWEISRSHLVVRGQVKGIDAARFEELARIAKDNCPVSKALLGNVEVTVEATLA